MGSWPSFVNVMRADLRNGIGRKQFSAFCEPTEMGRGLKTGIRRDRGQKISKRRLHGRERIIVPVHSEYDPFQMVRLGIGNGEPDMSDDPGPAQLRDGPFLAGLDRVFGVPIVVAPSRIGGRGTPLHIVLLKGKGRQVLRGARACKYHAQCR